MKTKSNSPCTSAFKLQFIGLDGREGLSETECASEQDPRLGTLPERRNLLGYIPHQLRKVMNKCIYQALNRQ